MSVKEPARSKAEHIWKVLSRDELDRLSATSGRGRFWLVWYQGKIFQMDPQYAGPGPPEIFLSGEAPREDSAGL